jgi:malonyl-CoA O-methyltransferase
VVSREALPAREAYRLWAPHYDTETVVSALEARVVAEVGPPVAGRSLLDAACGTGRRLPAPDAGCRRVVGVDLVPAMLTAGRARDGRTGGPRAPDGWAGDPRERDGRARDLPADDGRVGALVAADLRCLPFPAGSFDLVWCRLALGHLADLSAAYTEFARVTGPGAALVVSDFHPDAIAAGHARTFRDAVGDLHAVEHHVHTPDDHARAAETAGWRVESRRATPAGMPERAFYDRAGRLEQFERERDLPLVLVLCLRR